MKVGLYFQQALQELGGGHDRQCGMILEAFPVVCDYHIAATGKGTLILHHVLEITDKVESSSFWTAFTENILCLLVRKHFLCKVHRMFAEPFSLRRFRDIEFLACHFYEAI